MTISCFINLVCVVCTYTHTLTVHSQTATNIFREIPISVSIITGGTAEFCCQLMGGVDALVDWTINGQPPNSSHSVTTKGTLSILVIRDVIHNNTNVSCIAKQPNGSSVVLLGKTDHVEILLQGECMV